MKPLAFAGSIALLSLVGCQSVGEGAKQEFSKDNTCPLDRIEMRERPELKPSSLEGPSTPPADIAAIQDV